jgi:hypothetical protein
VRPGTGLQLAMKPLRRREGANEDFCSNQSGRCALTTGVTAECDFYPELDWAWKQCAAAPPGITLLPTSGPRQSPAAKCRNLCVVISAFFPGTA